MTRQQQYKYKKKGQKVAAHWIFFSHDHRKCKPNAIIYWPDKLTHLKDITYF